MKILLIGTGLSAAAAFVLAALTDIFNTAEKVDDTLSTLAIAACAFFVADRIVNKRPEAPDDSETPAP
ncbi:MAG TPA: hypothetical protein QF764_16140 [Planctomycetota bacterium]|nr:hypothetical protein [Planctomycetota bacterium]